MSAPDGVDALRNRTRDDAFTDDPDIEGFRAEHRDPHAVRDTDSSVDAYRPTNTQENTQ
jgi:hypothetical protein